ncbi:cyanophycinase [Alteromonas halophila]|uniref:Cyanophycinase n=1 Tax=Alteromonas halophila TaxID=516698 RepID=A0A918JG21_9ALTE|nr:cyanophycinase [Alteromonas halophila]GGW79222.1 hypothetical protein GCM10007391_09930 [Alteromonas halophila]
MLVGGSLQTCSSFFPDNCDKQTQFSEAKMQNKYRISEQAYQRLVKNSAHFVQELKIFDALKANKYSESAFNETDRQGFFSQLESLGISNKTIQHLPDEHYYALLDSHEVYQTSAQGERLKEQVSLMHTENVHSKAIYQAFVDEAAQRAGGKTPHILVVTASSRDPFAVVDFYTSVFTQAGARVDWLPVSAAFVEARQDGQCNELATYRARHHLYDRARVYPVLSDYQQQLCASPEKLRDLIATADGIFFNGGDQSKTLASLIDSEGRETDVLRTMRARVSAGKLIVGGTSAGTAVQAGGTQAGIPVPMLTSGDPATVMHDGVFFNTAPSVRCAQGESCTSTVPAGAVTLRSEGGTGLFHQGLLDTHFSERDRETRLIMATALSRQTLGFGVDETTALLVNTQGATSTFDVMGEGGVFVADMTDGQLVRDWTDGVVRHTVGGRAHYWTAGTQATYSERSWQVSLPGKPVTGRVVASGAQRDGVWRSQITGHCGARDAINWAQFGNHYSVKAAADTVFAKSEAGHCGYQSLPFAVSGPVTD